jgi:hypothetical protein
MASSGMTNDSVTPLAPIGIPQKVSSGNLHAAKNAFKSNIVDFYYGPVGQIITAL